MKAFFIDRYSKKDPMRLGDMPEPELRDDDVLIEIHAAGLNLLDSKIKSGEFKLILPYRLPLVLGHDVAGVVTKIGSRVRQFKVGDEVYSRPPDHRIGTFAEFIAVNERDVAPKPKNLTMEEAASIPLVSLTVWQALVERAHLKKGQKVFIQAGSGGGHLSHSTGQAYRGHGSHHHKQRQRRPGKEPRSRYRHRLQERRFRESSAELRCGPA